jgi:glyoxylase-like metal-dependent hydrolase (beta-lactamase superfamily II)
MSRSLPGVHEVLFPRAVVNAYVVLADVPTLIDTGTPGGSKRLLAAAARKAGVAARDIGRIILTHRHADHAGNAAALAAETGAEVHVSPLDAPYVSEGLEQPRPAPTTPLGRLMVPYVKVALPWRLAPVPVQQTLSDGAHVGPFRAVATPGHTAGHVSVLWEDRGILFTGDAAANITGVGPHPANDDPAAARATFRQLASLDFASACFGHGRTIASGAAAEFRRRA